MKKSLAAIKIQHQLRHLDLYQGLIDGDYGPATTDAVKQFQSKKGLSVDGIAGVRTQGALNTSTSNAWFNLFIHCSATFEGQDIKAHQIALFHTLPRDKGGRGWSKPGYSDVIELDGSLVNIHPFNSDNQIIDREVTFGVKWNTLLNSNARHVCYIGGCPPDTLFKAKDTRTDAQKRVLEVYIRYMLARNPKLVITGHNQVQAKGCPSFDVPAWCREIGIPEYNIANWGKVYS